MSKKSSSSLYPEVLQSNPDSETFSKKPTSSSSSSLYPSLYMKDLVDNLFPDNDEVPITTQTSSIASQPSIEETLLVIPGSIVHLIDKQQSVELASGDLTIVRLRQGDNVIAILLRIGHDIQWPLAKDEASVKLDQSHYFFSLRVPTSASLAGGSSSEEDDEVVRNDNNYLVNYGLTIASKGQDHLLKEFDEILEKYSSFSVQKVKAANVAEDVEVEMVNGSLAKETSPRELNLVEEKKEMMKDTSAAYWTTLAPNV
ncbi:Senescence/dehydration-associated protein-related, partial [Thalictrum thalictroides]